MRDIPMFSTELGVASLFLKDIPTCGDAYIKIHSTQDAILFLEECSVFCKAAGALHIYASGSSSLDSYPHKADVYLMRRENFKQKPSVELLPVQDHTLKQWLSIYNDAMKGVTMASYMSYQDGLSFLKERSAYFVYEQDRLLGIGIAVGEKIQAIVSCMKGAGEIVLKSLCSTLDSDTVCLEVASDNIKAIRLYDRLGFINSGITQSWYQVF